MSHTDKLARVVWCKFELSIQAMRDAQNALGVPRVGIDGVHAPAPRNLAQVCRSLEVASTHADDASRLIARMCEEASDASRA